MGDEGRKMKEETPLVKFDEKKNKWERINLFDTIYIVLTRLVISCYTKL